MYKGNSVTLNSTNISCTTTPPSPSLPCAKINADGVVTQLAYDSDGDLTSSSTPDGNGTQVAETTYTYDGDGEQTADGRPRRQPVGRERRQLHDRDRLRRRRRGHLRRPRPAGPEDPARRVTPRTTYDYYDADGNQTSVKDPRGYTTTYAYNADDEQTLVTDPDGNATLTCYDGDGHVTETVPPVGVAANSLTAASCPTSYPSGYGDRLASDATTYTYDGDGNKTAMTTPAPAGQSGYETTTLQLRLGREPDRDRGAADEQCRRCPNDDTYNTYNADGELATADDRVRHHGRCPRRATATTQNGDTTARRGARRQHLWGRRPARPRLRGW